MRYPFAERRQWFGAYLQRIGQGTTQAPRLGVRYPCPCCGYPTLEKRDTWEICDLCGWEDDGQDDPHAEEVWGGPNYDLSLTQARANFELYLDKCPPEQANTRYIGGADTPTEQATKVEMIAAFDEMIGQTEPTALDALWERVYRGQAILLEELNQKLLRHQRTANQEAWRPESS